MRRCTSRGVTLLELMAVVVIIGIFFLAASPSLSTALRDRKTARATDEIASLFRQARMRAAATGASHLVRIRNSGNAKRFELHAALSTTTAVGSCLVPSWVGAGASSFSSPTSDHIQLRVLDVATDASFATDAIFVSGLDVDFCFTPGGSTWWRNPTGVFQRAQGPLVLEYVLERQENSGQLVGLRRRVRIGASGLPTIVVDS